MPHQLVDIGVNLTNKAFREDLDQILDRAKQSGVIKMVATGTRVEASWDAYELAKKHPGVVYSTAGVHPHHASDCDDKTIGELRELCSREQVVVVGECGLDYNRNFSPPDVQRRWFEEQLRLAVELQLPVFMHERDAHGDFMAILSKYRGQLPRAVIHCFTGTGDVLDAYLELDLHIGITGWICDERRGTHLRDIVDRIPADRLMIETDAPYLLPRSMRPKPKKRRNEPSYLSHVLEAVSECVGRPTEQVARETTATADAFFSI